MDVFLLELAISFANYLELLEQTLLDELEVPNVYRLGLLHWFYRFVELCRLELAVQNGLLFELQLLEKPCFKKFLYKRSRKDGSPVCVEFLGVCQFEEFQM